MTNVPVSITPSEVIEFTYCPRFVYFMLCLKIPQNEHTKFKVQIGREIHQKKTQVNKDYLRKTFGVVRKLSDQRLYSEINQIHGIVDEVLFFEENGAAPLDYKFAEYTGKVFKTYKSQLALYALLIEENYNCSVERGFLVYTRSKNKVVEVPLSKKDKLNALESTQQVVKIIEKGYYPEATPYKKRCDDCCYRNVCIQ